MSASKHFHVARAVFLVLNLTNGSIERDHVTFTLRDDITSAGKKKAVYRSVSGQILIQSHVKCDRKTCVPSSNDLTASEHHYFTVNTQGMTAHERVNVVLGCFAILNSF